MREIILEKIARNRLKVQEIAENIASKGYQVCEVKACIASLVERNIICFAADWTLEINPRTDLA